MLSDYFVSELRKKLQRKVKTRGEVNYGQRRESFFRFSWERA